MFKFNNFVCGSEKSLFDCTTIPHSSHLQLTAMQNKMSLASQFPIDKKSFYSDYFFYIYMYYILFFFIARFLLIVSSTIFVLFTKSCMEKVAVRSDHSSLHHFVIFLKSFCHIFMLIFHICETHLLTASANSLRLIPPIMMSLVLGVI